METVSHYARRAGLTPRAVRARIERGSLDAVMEGGRWFVLDHSDAAPRRRGRLLSSASFDLLAAYADDDLTGLTQDERRRAKERMARLRSGGLAEVRALSRRPDMRVKRFRAGDADLQELREEPRLSLTGVSSPLSRVYGPIVDGYVDHGDSARLELFHMLEPVQPGEQNVVLRLVPRRPTVRALHVVADLLDDGHARSRVDAGRLLAEVLG